MILIRIKNTLKYPIRVIVGEDDALHKGQVLLKCRVLHGFETYGPFEISEYALRFLIEDKRVTILPPE